MTDKPDPRHRRWGTAAWVWVVLLGLYPLSIGPACWLTGKTPPAWMAIVYAPIIWAKDNSSLFDDLAMWYIGLWIDVPKT